MEGLQVLSARRSRSALPLTWRDTLLSGSQTCSPDADLIARLVCADRTEEWWPARAVRWTEDAVLVGYESSPGDQKSLRHLWLAIDDVARVIRPPVANP